jgi:hypothetical protein
MVFLSPAQQLVQQLFQLLGNNLISMGWDFAQELHAELWPSQHAPVSSVGSHSAADDSRALESAFGPPKGTDLWTNTTHPTPSADQRVLGNDDVMIDLPEGWTLRRDTRGLTAVAAVSAPGKLTMVEVTVHPNGHAPEDPLGYAREVIGRFVTEGTTRSADPVQSDVLRSAPLSVAFQDFLANQTLGAHDFFVHGRLLVARHDDGRWVECICYDYPPRREDPRWRSVVGDAIASFRISPTRNAPR